MAHWPKHFTLVFMQLFPKQALVFTCLQYKSFENTAGKGEVARNVYESLSVSDFFGLQNSSNETRLTANTYMYDIYASLQNFGSYVF